MILAVAPNPALDVTYGLGELHRGRVQRVRTVSERPGGKAVNVGRVLHELGERVLVTGMCGGPGGVALQAALDRAGVPADLLDVLPDVRRTLVVQETSGMTTSLWEPGYAPVDPPAAADALTRHVSELLAGADTLVVSGSLPPGVDPGLPARLVDAAVAAGVPAVVDVSGPALRAAADAGGAVLMPNADELAELIGHRPSTPAEAVRAARRLLPPAGRVPAVVLTLGTDGMAVVRPDRALLAAPPERIQGNATGAGDAACAAVARHLAAAGSLDAVDWRALLVDAVALSAAAVLRPVAGEVDVRAYRRWRDQVRVEEA
ncbi:1-phosphofructokinase family hexose kinase [Micromonospora sp. CV4]|uniref:1-phosphofructokinase family hexose kinase n=1 Tax=Micromonospora sp. CV4 TaxID=2478711 RepID=UPI0018F39560|nr:hexose kinase [Micromonospora sp. CV4]